MPRIGPLFDATCRFRQRDVLWSRLRDCLNIHISSSSQSVIHFYSAAHWSLVVMSLFASCAPGRTSFSRSLNKHPFDTLSLFNLQYHFPSHTSHESHIYHLSGHVFPMLHQKAFNNLLMYYQLTPTVQPQTMGLIVDCLIPSQYVGLRPVALIV